MNLDIKLGKRLFVPDEVIGKVHDLRSNLKVTLSFLQEASNTSLDVGKLQGFMAELQAANIEVPEHLRIKLHKATVAECIRFENYDSALGVVFKSEPDYEFDCFLKINVDIIEAALVKFIRAFKGKGDSDHILCMKVCNFVQCILAAPEDKRAALSVVE